MRHPDLIYDLLQKGCLSQITASSYVGTFGDKVQNFSQQLIEAGQGYVFASDAHNLPGRKYEMREAFNKLRMEFGSGLVEEFKNNAKAIINGDAVIPHQIRIVKGKRKKFFGLF